ncbi:MAG: hypothetical protein ABW212_20900 [Pseudonocardia sediminis]
MSLGLWIGLGLLAWVVLAVGVALLIGRIVRQRDRQVPDDAPGAPSSGPAEPASSSGQGVPRQGGPPDASA